MDQLLFYPIYWVSSKWDLMERKPKPHFKVSALMAIQVLSSVSLMQLFLVVYEFVIELLH